MSIGLTNRGATCYAASLTQLLWSCPILSVELQRDTNLSSDTEAQYDALLNAAQMPGGQQDSHEMFMALVDKYDALRSATQFVSQFTLRCAACAAMTSRTTKQNMLCCVDRTEPIAIHQFITGTSQHCENYRCERCGSLSVYNTEQVVVPPRTFIVTFPTKCSAYQLSETFVIRGGMSAIRYSLRGVVDHHGVAESGHYIARVRRGNDCYVANDSSICSTTSIAPNSNTVMALYSISSVWFDGGTTALQ